MIDLTRATKSLSDVLARVGDNQLSAPTPCTETTVGALIDHVDGLSLAFTAAAKKTPLPGGSQPPSSDASRLGDDWRIRVPNRLAELAAAWQDDQAWAGMTQAGGVELPGEAAGLVALDEVLVHGWDIAAATGQPYDADPDLVEAALGFVRPTVEQNPNGTPGLFGPRVAVGEDATPLDRLLGLTGRDPRWRAPVS